MAMIVVKCSKWQIYLCFANLIYTMRVIPQGMIDNKLGPHRLAGPKSLDPNSSRQPTL